MHSEPSRARFGLRPIRVYATRRRLHRFAIFTSLWIFALIFLGGMVKSTNSGLSVPDWPNTYGHFMFFFPWKDMVGGIFWEHSHRMVASVAGLLTFALTAFVYLVDDRRWVRRLSMWASVAVLAQGVLGGLTVLLYLPTWVSSSHGTLAQLYLCMVVTIAIATSERWKDDVEPVAERPGWSLRRLAFATTITIFCQLVIGAVMRHSEAGLAVPDFPMMFGSWVPPLSAARLASANRELIAMDLAPVTMWQMVAHLMHRLGALAVTTMILWTSTVALRRYRDIPVLRRNALLLLSLLVVQLTLGILTILTQKQPEITSLHVVTGAATLVTSLILTVRAHYLVASRAAGALARRDARAESPRKEMEEAMT
ncbi:MAG TPA: COX15/CtaA family protein [Candidatus Kapabacteria bacterium]|nr:COX15/CtaA family protein [Candidatus Kapabacteria bacterium]